MLGRGTRLSPNLFGPGKHKEFFYIFDYCQNLEFFKENPQVSEGAGSDSLGKRLFKARLQLVGELDANNLKVGDSAAQSLREDVVGVLHAEVAAMNVNNFVVRPKADWSSNTPRNRPGNAWTPRQVYSENSASRSSAPRLRRHW